MYDLVPEMNSLFADAPKTLTLPVGGIDIVVRSKTVAIDGANYELNPHMLIRMIKQVTQTIGEYKRQQNAYSAFIVASLRKARSDMVSVLENKFKINWKLDRNTNESVFFM